MLFYSPNSSESLEVADWAASPKSTERLDIMSAGDFGAEAVLLFSDYKSENTCNGISE